MAKRTLSRQKLGPRRLARTTQPVMMRCGGISASTKRHRTFRTNCHGQPLKSLSALISMGELRAGSRRSSHSPPSWPSQCHCSKHGKNCWKCTARVTPSASTWSEQISFCFGTYKTHRSAHHAAQQCA